jgi:nucleoside-triphosphatase THEP1
MGGTLTILTGPSGLGKTTLCREVAEAARSAGHDVAGLVCPASFTQSRKVGISAHDLRTRETRELAWLPDPARPGGLTHGQWTFDESVLAWGNELFQRATPCELLIVDELGRLELLEQRGWTSGVSALSSRDYERALVVVRTDLVSHALSLWPEASVVYAGDAVARARLLEPYNKVRRPSGDTR